MTLFVKKIPRQTVPGQREKRNTATGLSTIYTINHCTLLSSFFYPDFTVGHGFSPCQSSLKGVADFTADREFHPALKNA